MSIGLQAYLQGYVHEKTAETLDQTVNTLDRGFAARARASFANRGGPSMSPIHIPAVTADEVEAAKINRRNTLLGLLGGTGYYKPRGPIQDPAILQHMAPWPQGFDTTTKPKRSTLSSILGGAKHIAKRYGEDFTKGTSDIAGTAADRTLEGTAADLEERRKRGQAEPQR